MLTPEEKKNRKIGIAISFGIHAGLILLFFLIFAWKAPDPPLPEYGIQLNFGVSETGSGEQQPQTPAEPAETIEEQVTEEPSEPVSEPIEEVEEVTEPNEVEQEIVEEQISEVESPHVVEDKPEPQPEKKPEPKPVEEKEPEKVVDENALYPGGGNNKPGNQSTSQGDQGQQGDQGNEQGSVDSRALYGKPGGGDGGPVINLSNWSWDKINIKKDPSSENGKIVFQIKVDDAGYIMGISVLETTVSQSVVRYYQNQVEKFTFTFRSSSGNSSPAAQSTGTITLYIRQQ